MPVFLPYDISVLILVSVGYARTDAGDASLQAGDMYVSAGQRSARCLLRELRVHEGGR